MISKADQQLAFEKVYQGLNEAQKKAVDTIEGPVMVIAGPGTASHACSSSLAHPPCCGNMTMSPFFASPTLACICLTVDTPFRAS